MTSDLLRAAFALGLVVLLILAFGIVMRRFGDRVPRRAGKRLAVVESLSLDPRRRLVILRKDGAEHLVLLGPGGDIVIERASAPPPPAPPPLPSAAESP
ncbi:FliO/MopB family protein [Zavarzinia sp.]|uniref:FliO/MopB family protein n=1 Tax=Zavarzinia sp. TaxID=2027920 RepID=UPI003BB4CA66